MEQLEHQVLSYIKEQQLITPGDRLLIACSGGVDSMALLSFFDKFQRLLDVELVVAHVDHMLRGEQSAGDLQFVEFYCQEHGLNFVSRAIPIRDILAKEGGNSQTICRRERYQFLREMMQQQRIDKLVTAHHADDQLESMLMAMTKSGSLNGLKAMSPQRDFFTGKLIRPFLMVTKQDIREYLQKNSGNYREDPSNAKEDYTRNRFRHRIVPLLKQENTNVSIHAVQLTEQLQQDDIYLQQLAQQLFSRLVVKNGENSYVLEITAFQNEPVALQRRLILILLNYLYNDSNTIHSYALCASILKLFDTLEGSVTINLPEDFIARRQYEKVFFEKQFSAVNIARRELVLNDWNDLNGLRVYIGELARFGQSSEQQNTYYFNSTSVCFPLYVRARKEGDRIAQRGMPQAKKVSRIFIDDKIPLVERNRWPLLVDAQDELLAVLAVRVNNKFSKVQREDDDFVIVMEREF